MFGLSKVTAILVWCFIEQTRSSTLYFDNHSCFWIAVDHSSFLWITRFHCDDLPTQRLLDTMMSFPFVFFIHFLFLVFLFHLFFLGPEYVVKIGLDSFTSRLTIMTNYDYWCRSLYLDSVLSLAFIKRFVDWIGWHTEAGGSLWI